jgi:cytochrome c556
MLKRLSIAILCLSLPMTALTHDNQKNPEVRYRHAVMEAMSNQFEAMALIFQGKVERPDALQVHAKVLAELATLIGGLFPENSKGAKALPILWDEPAKVAEASMLMAEAAVTLAEVAAGSNKAEIGKAFKAAGDACKSCHERYKEADE